jgi:sodium-dependent phosphate transporter
MFFLVRTFVLKSKDPFNRSAMTYSLVIFITLAINSFFVMHKGLKKFKIDTGIKLAIAFGSSFVVAVIFQVAVVGWLKNRIIRLENEAKEGENLDVTSNLELESGTNTPQEDGSEDSSLGKEKKEATTDSLEIGSDVLPVEKVATTDSLQDGSSDSLPVEDEKKETRMSNFFKKVADSTYKRDLEKEAMDMDEDAADLWDKSELYDAKSEVLYSYLQVFTACALSFAHGSNDVANAIAPICAVLAIYETGVLTKTAPVPQWVLVMGAIGIVVGLALFGYKVIISIGYRLTKLSPSRGFCIQLSTTLVVVTASYVGIPVSTTQSTIGGTVGVGAVEGAAKVQWKFMLKVFFGWVGTFFITCLSSAGIMAFCYYSPSAPSYYIIANSTSVA